MFVTSHRNDTILVLKKKLSANVKILYYFEYAIKSEKYSLHIVYECSLTIITIIPINDIWL